MNTKVTLIGRHVSEPMPGVEIAEQVNVEWPLDLGECRAKLREVFSAAQAPNLLLQNVPGILAAALFAERDIFAGRGLGIIISVPGPRLAGVTKSWPVEAEGAAVVEAAVAHANGRARVTVGDSTVTVTVDPVSPFRFDHIEWVYGPAQPTLGDGDLWELWAEAPETPVCGEPPFKSYSPTKIYRKSNRKLQSQLGLPEFLSPNTVCDSAGNTRTVVFAESRRVRFTTPEGKVWYDHLDTSLFDGNGNAVDHQSSPCHGAITVPCVTVNWFRVMDEPVDDDWDTDRRNTYIGRGGQYV